MLSDIKIAQAAKMKPIIEIAKKIGIKRKYLELYGDYKAKVSLDILKEKKAKRHAKYIDVTAITPTPLGEGKTVTTIGLSMALNYIGKKTITCIRQPSLGPVFGIKGGAAGGGYAQVSTTISNVDTYVDTGLIPGTTYYYRVSAYNSAGSSGYCSESWATTETSALIVPVAPSELTAVAVSSIEGRTPLSAIVATPRIASKPGSCVRPSGSASEGIMNRLVSVPAVSPSWSRPALPRRLLFRMYR